MFEDRADIYPRKLWQAVSTEKSIYCVKLYYELHSYTCTGKIIATLRRAISTQQIGNIWLDQEV